MTVRYRRRMARNEQDPAGSTQQFRAFSDRREPAMGRPSAGLVIGLTTAVLVVAVVLLVLLFG